MTTEKATKTKKVILIPPEDRILVPAGEAAVLCSMGKSTFWREVARGTIPAPVKIGGLTRWRVADLVRIGQPANANATP